MYVYDTDPNRFEIHEEVNMLVYSLNLNKRYAYFQMEFQLKCFSDIIPLAFVYIYNYMEFSFL